MTPRSEDKGNILLVDDLPDNLLLLNDLLVDLGYSVRSVTSGQMTLQTIQVKPPDLILLDIKMPDLDGYQVCEMIKTQPQFQEIPIIFISAVCDTFDKVKAFNLGAADYITKPFQLEEVVARLEHQLTIQRQKQALKNEISKRLEAEEILYQSRALLASVLNTALDGIAALEAMRDPETGEIKDFRCLVVNPIIAKIFQRRREELVGKPILKHFLHKLDSALFERLVAVVETGHPLEEDIYYEFNDSCWFHFLAVKLGDGFAVTIRDITSRKRLELELQAANDQLYQLAHRDGLTQIANRRSFDLTLQREWQRHLCQQRPLALLMMDVDYFKAYNDYYGHQAGDDCLYRLAQALEAVITAKDGLARYGGEEFALILPETDQAAAIAMAEKIQTAIQGLQIPHQLSDVEATVTLSIGIACGVPLPAMPWESLCRQADEALYEAKKQGRNRYFCYQIPEPSLIHLPIGTPP